MRLCGIGSAVFCSASTSASTIAAESIMPSGLPDDGGVHPGRKPRQFSRPAVLRAGVPARGVLHGARHAVSQSRWRTGFCGVGIACPSAATAATSARCGPVLRLLGEGKAVLMFPEGTRSPDGQLQEARAGIGMIVARARVPDRADAHLRDGTGAAAGRLSSRARRG